MSIDNFNIFKNGVSLTRKKYAALIILLMCIHQFRLLDFMDFLVNYKTSQMGYDAMISFRVIQDIAEIGSVNIIPWNAILLITAVTFMLKVYAGRVHKVVSVIMGYLVFILFNMLHYGNLLLLAYMESGSLQYYGDSNYYGYVYLYAPACIFGFIAMIVPFFFLPKSTHKERKGELTSEGYLIRLLLVSITLAAIVMGLALLGTTLSNANAESIDILCTILLGVGAIMQLVLLYRRIKSYADKPLRIILLGFAISVFIIAGFFTLFITSSVLMANASVSAIRFGFMLLFIYFLCTALHRGKGDAVDG